MIKPALNWLLWPAIVAANAAPMIAVTVYAPSMLPVALALTSALLIVLLLGIECALPYRREWSFRGDSEIWRDIGHTVVYGQAITLSRLLFLFALAGLLDRMGYLGIANLWPSSGALWLQILMVIVAGDALEYGYHRLAHSFSLLWRLHAVHHSPERLHVLKGGRHHFLYAFGRGFVVWTPLLLLGAPPELIFWQYVAEVITGLVGHANIDFRMPRFLHRLLVTPEFHRLHHCADSRHGNSNYAVVLPLWDMIFRSHTDPNAVPVATLGIQNDPIPRRFLAELLSPFTYGHLVTAKRHATQPLRSSGRG